MMYQEPAFTLKWIDVSSSASIAAGAQESIELKPPSGKSWQFVMYHCYILRPVGSTAGTHTLGFYFDNDTNLHNRFMQCISDFNVAIDIGRYQSLVGTTDSPSATSDQERVQQGGLWATNDEPVILYYDNQTDVAQATSRILKVCVKEYNGGGL